MAFVRRDTWHGREVWAVVWNDALKGAGRAGRRKTACVGGDHSEAFDAADLSGDERAALALGARTKALQRALVKCYDALEAARTREAARLRGRRSRHDTTLDELIDAYLALLRYRVGLFHRERPALPGSASGLWRAGFQEKPLAPSTEEDIRRILERFRSWAPRGLTTGSLDASILTGFLGSLLHDRDRRVSSRTYNKCRTYLRTMFGGLTTDALAQLFRRDPREFFRDQVESLPVRAPEIVVYPVDAIAAFLTEAERQAVPGRAVAVRRLRAGRQEEYAISSGTPPAPVIETALLLLCTGARRGEALGLTWDDVDLAKGVLTIRAATSKTGRTRYVPLAGDPAGDVAPRFLELLRAWREADPRRLHLLPENGREGPALTNAWDRVRVAAGLEDFGAQGCRRTFESALACIGVPCRLSAFWLGHDHQVAEKHYLAFAPGRLPGRTVEEILGLAPFLDRALERARANRPFRLVGTP